MPQYRRWRQSGGTYFFTVNLANRQSDLLVRRIDNLRQAFAHEQRRRPFKTRAAVILPEHLHLIWTLPMDDADFSTRWRRIKDIFTRSLPVEEHRYPISLSRHKRGERDIWQRRFHEHLIRDEDDLFAHVNYIHYNPVKHGLVDHPADWPYSSIHRYIKGGHLDPSWTGEGLEDMNLE